ncbi:MAG TPA: FadR/GntR family transcriptional regulator [Hyphomicrobiaceae bacterium]|nr:FadR/GntR family transcriptional regulator [Hyphomicrobiaceae bacterium]
MPIEVLVPRRLYRQIAEQLRQLIEGGEYPVGSRLPTERELAKKLGVSRPTVREALIALEVEGRLRIKVGSGIYVIEPQHQQVSFPEPIAGPFEVLNARALVESTTAEEAARRADRADIARLDAVLAETEATQPSFESWVAHDREFHLAVAGTLGNAVLVRCVGELFDQRINPYFERLARHFETPSAWRAAQAEHRIVRDAIAAHDPKRARMAMRQHLERSHARFARDFSEAPDIRCVDRKRSLRPPKVVLPPRRRQVRRIRTAVI